MQVLVYRKPSSWLLHLSKIKRDKNLVLFIVGVQDSNPESLVPKTSMLAVTPHPDILFSISHFTM